MGEGTGEQPSDAKGLIIVVDDEEAPRRASERALTREGYRVVTFDTASKALAFLQREAERVDLVLSDLNMPKMNGLELLSTVKDSWPDVIVVLLTGQDDVHTAVDAMRRGAYDYLTKPIDPVDTLLPAVQRAVERRRLLAHNQFLQRQLEPSALAPNIIGESRAIRDVLSMASSAAPTDATVLILGESGTGKELVARAIHDQSKRMSKPFVAVNCGALSEHVLESELFGHVKGAFTGAVASRRGLFEEASGGTLFLDEVGELTAATQVRLLRVLQEGTIRPVGSNESRKVDVRIVAATNRDLGEEVEQGKFRDDLYYRLDVITIRVPPLRQRPSDIPLLCSHFLKKHSARFEKNVTGIAPEVLASFCTHRWPGNVRELENTVARAIVLCKTDTIDVTMLPAVLRTAPEGTGLIDDPRWLVPLAEAKAAFEQEYLDKVLERANGKQSEAARFAGLDPSNFRRLLKRSQIESKGD